MQVAQEGDRLVFREAGRVYGRVVGGAFVKYVDPAIHMLREPPAWAVQAVVLEELWRRGVQVVELRDQRTRVVLYDVLVEQFVVHGFEVDRGHGRQRALALQRWRPRSEEGTRLLRHYFPRQPAGEQGSLL